MRLLTKLTLIFSIITAQEYTWPTNTGKHLSSNFGEFRPTGFHLGLDIKTKGTVGHPVYAISNGYISRIVTNYSGFGRALYLTLEDGQTAVYAHLSKFNSQLEELLKLEQEKNQSYITNIFLAPEEFEFERGDIIGYSGNTGFSFGPHLHFEIRNKKGQTLNPLTNGLDQADRMAPIAEQISFIPLTSESWINGNQLPQNFTLFRNKKGEYHFPDTINIFGVLGMSLKTFDKRQGANNIYQPHRIEVYIDEKLHHSLQFDRLDYNWLSTANFIKDYNNARLNLGNFIKLYRNETDPSVPIHSSSTNGILELTPGHHDIKIHVMDHLMNLRIIRGTVFIMAPFDLMVKPLGETKELVSFLIQSKNISVPIKSVVAYSFTPYGYADEKLSIQSSETLEEGKIVTILKKQINRKAIQFMAENNLGTISRPLHWLDSQNYSDYLDVNIDMDISYTDAGIYIQIQPEKIVDADFSLRLKGKYQYETISLNQIQPSVFLTKPLSPILFEEVDQIEAILNGPIERQIRFDFPYTVVQPGSSITAISEDGLFSIRTKNNSISRSSLIWIEAVNKYAPVKKGNHLSRVYQLQPFQQPLLNPINIAIRYASKYKDRNKLHLYFYDQKEGWSFIQTENNNERQVLTGEIKQLDAITIIEDVVPPIIKSIHPGHNGKYPSLELSTFKIKIDDLLSGFDPSESSFELILDDQSLIYAYQPKLKTISYELDRPLLIGEHSLQFTVKDRAGNKASQTVKFKVY
ncbi:MAG: M23 family metallopeptidase [Candidatus Marinimicrobia bacterium]|nr:M23 family metallopeptidase [Candidatus Neomarinimicrobiota bacterium]